MNRVARWPWLLLMGLFLLLDQLSKLWVRAALPVPGLSVKTLIPDILLFRQVHNRGMVWGFLSHLNLPPWGLGLVTLLALALIVVVFWRSREPGLLEPLGFALVIGGAAGNIVDRFFRGYVVDFIEVWIGSYCWPNFNLADAFINIGVGVLLLSAFFSWKRSRHLAHTSTPEA